MKTLQRLSIIGKLNEKNKNYKNKDLYRILYNEDIYITAYEKLKSNPSNVNNSFGSLDGFQIETIKSIIESIKNESIKFTPADTVEIPKANKKSTRIIHVGSPRDKVILEAIRMILEAIYEPIMIEESHGYRPSKSCHTALKTIRTTYTGVSWFIEGDISKFFDNIDREKLIKILQKKIDDIRFLNLIRKVINTGYLSFGIYKTNIAGVPQGNIISPILANIYLNEFDIWITGLLSDLSIGKSRKRDSEITSCWNNLARWKKNLKDKSYLNSTKKHKSVEEAIAKCTKNIAYWENELGKIQGKKSTFNLMDPNYKRFRYVRYADDFLIGVIGSKNDCIILKDKIKDFLANELNIELNIEKTKIKHSSEGTTFLGVEIRVKRMKEKKVIKRIVHNKLSGEKLSDVRLSNRKLQMRVSKSRLLKKLESGGFCDGQGKSKPKYIWMWWKHDDIIRSYNSIIQGINNYYSFVDNPKVLTYIYSILRQSLVKLFCAKYSLRTQAQVWKKYGSTLSENINKRSAKFISSRDAKLRPMDFKINPSTDLTSLYIKRRSNSMLGKVCAICGSDNNVQMHHVKHIRKMNKKLKPMEKSMVTLNRKQIPVCINCHTDIHNGKYDGINLKDIIS